MSTTEIPAGARGYDHFAGSIGRTFADSSPAWDEKSGKQGPNIVLVVIDDLGFSDLGPYGSEIATPAINKVAAQGVRFANYHTTPVCSPSRAALLTGLNPHRAGFAAVAAYDPGFPNLTLQLADDVVTLPEALRSSGYATFAVGKWHLTKEVLIHDAADRSSWPLQRGFDRYYGSLEGFNTFFAPNRMVRDNSPVDRDDYDDDYYVTDDLTDEAISMIRSHRVHDATKPFFLYFAHHAMHGPLGSKPATRAKYRGRYAEGWGELRRQRFNRQVASGLWPDSVVCAPANTEAGYDVPEWSDLSDDDRQLMAAYMEVYAAMVESVDESLERIMTVLEEQGELDDTIILVTSDNGGTHEGGVRGTRSYFSQFALHVQPPETWERDVPLDPAWIGGPRSMVHYPRGWAMASNTPFRFYKASTFAGGIRVPFLMSWPAAVKDGRLEPGTRDQYAYVTDVLPTLLDLAGVERPSHRAGVPVQDLDGTSFAEVVRTRNAAATRTEQYSEFNGHRGFYADGWKLLTLHEPGTPYDDREWELYDVARDPTETSNLARDRPEVVRELAARWEKVAWANTVFPMNDHSGVLAHRHAPDHVALSRPARIFRGTPTTDRYRSAQLIRMKSWSVRVDGTLLDQDIGVVVAHGDQGGGYHVRVEQGRIVLCYNQYGVIREASAAFEGPVSDLELIAEALPEFRWRLSLRWADDERAALESVAMLLGMAPFTGISVGADRGGPVSWDVHDRHRTFPFTGDLRSVTYVPGRSADYDPALVHDAAHLAAQFYD